MSWNRLWNDSKATKEFFTIIKNRKFPLKSHREILSDSISSLSFYFNRSQKYFGRNLKFHLPFVSLFLFSRLRKSIHFWSKTRKDERSFWMVDSAEVAEDFRRVWLTNSQMLSEFSEFFPRDFYSLQQNPPLSTASLATEKFESFVEPMNGKVESKSENKPRSIWSETLFMAFSAHILFSFVNLLDVVLKAN